MLLPEPISEIFKVAAEFGLERYMRERKAIAQEEIVRAMRNGRPWVIADDQTAGMALQYLRAYQEGVSRLNLRLIAQAMFTQGAEQSLQPSEYRRQAESLAGLSLDEILLCARFVKLLRKLPPLSEFPGKDERQEQRDERLRLWDSEILVLSAGLDRDQIAAACSSLLRTGWLRTVGNGKDHAMFTPTPSFEAIARMVEFEEVAATAESTGNPDA